MIAGFLFLVVDLQGRDPKKSRNLIAASRCFCGWIDFGVLEQLGRDPEKNYNFVHSLVDFFK